METTYEVTEEVAAKWAKSASLRVRVKEEARKKALQAQADTAIIVDTKGRQVDAVEVTA